MKQATNRYYIEIRYFGKAKHQIRRIIQDVDNKFSLKKSKKVPHITLIQPFSTSKEKRLKRDFQRVCSKFKRVKFDVRGIGVFPFFVVFAKIKPSKELLKLRKDLFSTLKTYSKITDKNRQYKPHTTIALRMGFFKFFRIWKYLLFKPQIDFTNHALRVTLLKGQKILCEYDLFQRKLLNRRAALSKRGVSKTFGKLRENSK